MQHPPRESFGAPAIEQINLKDGRFHEIVAAGSVEDMDVGEGNGDSDVDFIGSSETMVTNNNAYFEETYAPGASSIDYPGSMVSVSSLLFEDTIGTAGSFFGVVNEGGRPNGMGTFECDAYTYIGKWKDGVRHGYGILRNKENKERQQHSSAGAFQGEWMYSGEWFQHERNGKGVQTFFDGTLYKGDFVKDEWHGEGILERPTATGDGTTTVQYTGEFVYGEMNGRATLGIREAGDWYVGEVREGQPHGYGMLEFADGRTYVGEFECGLQHGTGTLIFNKQRTHANGFAMRTATHTGNCTHKRNLELERWGRGLLGVLDEILVRGRWDQGNPLEVELADEEWERLTYEKLRRVCTPTRRHNNRQW